MRLKNFFDYLFYKYYHFQILVGNGDRAFFMTILSMAFVTFLYVASITMIFLFFIIPTKIIINPWCGVILISIIFLIFYLIFTNGRRYNSIIDDTRLSQKVICQ
ncbi:MAG: hypothetical protein DI535_29880 [Citrobacter freundii]|nr:MAG: hypothetical protein DI535_29880 [Citrobacter freundii]